MNAVQSKQERKQARRAIGEAGLNVLGQHSQDVRHLKARINELEAIIVAVQEEDRRAYHVGNEQYRQLSGMDEAITADLRAFRDRTLWGRLRWLLRGR